MRTDSVNLTHNPNSNLVVTNNFRLFVVDTLGVEEVYMPVMAKSLYLMLLRNPNGIAFDESFMARKDLIDAHYDITHSLLDESGLQSIIALTEPPTGNIEAMCDLIRNCFIDAIGAERAQPFLVDCSNPTAVRIALPADRVVW